MIIIDIISIFPKMFNNIINYGVIKEAFNKNLCQLNIYNLREFTDDKHKKIDDRPFGGGPGMVMKIQPIDSAVNFIKKKNNIINKDLQKTIFLSPKGSKLSQSKLKYLSNLENIIIICGRYEGIDERVKELFVDMELSIGDYVLTGGEIPSMVVIDGVIRLLSGVVGKKESLKYESFEDNLLDYPQYTRPPIYKGYKVPEILLSGNHKEIKKWRKEEAISLTKKRRPDLFDKNN
jgi:tRNA (guanine37-N1)-methyltransferase